MSPISVTEMRRRSRCVQLRCSEFSLIDDITPSHMVHPRVPYIKLFSTIYSIETTLLDKAMQPLFPSLSCSVRLLSSWQPRHAEATPTNPPAAVIDRTCRAKSIIRDGM